MPSHPMLLLIDAIAETLKKSGDLATYAGERVYLDQAPPGTLLECVEYEFTEGGPTNRSPRPDFDVTVEVRALSTKLERALSLAQAISQTMIQSGGIVIPGWDVYDSNEMDWFVRKLWREGQEYRVAGAFYRICACKRG